MRAPGAASESRRPASTIVASSITTSLQGIALASQIGRVERTRPLNKPPQARLERRQMLDAVKKALCAAIIKHGPQRSS